jgi:hypothetical protein
MHEWDNNKILIAKSKLLFCRYDLTPITVKYTKRRKPFYSFITMIFAIIGGTFSVAGIIDSLVFTASNIFKKFELGKLS